ncbi:MAG TPA: metallophosphoesterase [Polyangiaceae bacterium]|nr:metallophosphoesterase [Polyangiaceae bacterium]
MKPFIVTSDLHLSADASASTVRDLARLLRDNPGHEFILAGDVFNLSWEAPGRSAVEAVLSLMTAQPDLASAFRSQLAAGSPLTFIAGNHDAGLMSNEMREALLHKLDVSGEAPLQITPWFARRGEVHIEHGHFYDPDNAPAHPLAEWSPRTEPLGIAITRRFVRPRGVDHFLHAHDTTPLAGISKAFRVYGARTPLIIAEWFRVAGKLCLETRHAARFDVERGRGEAALSNFARMVELDPEVLRALLEAGAEPTHRDFQKTFMRLYFDRVFASSGLLLSSAAYLAWKSRAAGIVGLLSGLYLIQSVQRTGNRYEDLPVERLRAAATRVRELTNAKVVIFGHTHQVDEVPGYANSGSFGYSRYGRPYVRVDATGAPRLERLERA